MSKVRKTDAGCWEWLGSVRPNQAGMEYGGFWLNGKTRKAHVCALILLRGTDPAGAVVRHTCDRPSCVNPDHLLVGTHQENMADRSERGRTAARERIASAKLTEADVSRARAMHAAGESGAAIARSLGIHTSTACRIVRGDTWR